MIGLFVALVIVIVLANVAKFVHGIDMDQKKEFLGAVAVPEKHTLHKWLYHSVTGKLSCEECGFVAGTHVPSRDDND